MIVSILNSIKWLNNKESWRAAPLLHSSSVIMLIVSQQLNKMVIDWWARDLETPSEPKRAALTLKSNSLEQLKVTSTHTLHSLAVSQFRLCILHGPGRSRSTSCFCRLGNRMLKEARWDDDEMIRIYQIRWCNTIYRVIIINILLIIIIDNNVLIIKHIFLCFQGFQLKTYWTMSVAPLWPHL